MPVPAIECAVLRGGGAGGAWCGLDGSAGGGGTFRLGGPAEDGRGGGEGDSSRNARASSAFTLLICGRAGTGRTGVRVTVGDGTGRFGVGGAGRARAAGGAGGGTGRLGGAGGALTGGGTGRLGGAGGGGGAAVGGGTGRLGGAGAAEGGGGGRVGGVGGGAGEARDGGAGGVGAPFAEGSRFGIDGGLPKFKGFAAFNDEG